MKRAPKYTLGRLAVMHAYVAANPDCTMHMICAHFKSPASTLRTPLQALVNSGHIDVVHGKRSQGGQAPNLYTATDKGVPTEVPERRPYGELTGRLIPDPSIKRIIKPARQIGMHRDPLVAALFGMAGAAA